jgi:hypothetical protein
MTEGRGIRYYESWAASMMEAEGPWTAAHTAAWSMNRPDGLIYRTEDDGNVDFLPELPGLRLLAVSGNPTDDSAIGRAVGLERVVLQTTAKNRLDWSALDRLARLDVSSRPGLESLAAAGGLQSLVVWECEEPDLSVLGTIGSLRELALKPARKLRSLAGIDGLPSLVSLELNYVPVALDLAPLGALPDLRVLTLQGCRRQLSLEGIEQSTGLRELYLEGCGTISSLEPLLRVPELGKLYLGGNTTIADGRLAILRRLPRLTFVDFPNHRDYDARSEEFPKEA